MSKKNIKSAFELLMEKGAEQERLAKQEKIGEKGKDEEAPKIETEEAPKIETEEAPKIKKTTKRIAIVKETGEKKSDYDLIRKIQNLNKKESGDKPASIRESDHTILSQISHYTKLIGERVDMKDIISLALSELLLNNEKSLLEIIKSSNKKSLF